MSQKSYDSMIPRQIEKAVLKLSSVAMASVESSQIISRINNLQLTPPELQSLIKVNPPLASNFFAKHFSGQDKRGSVTEALESVSLRQIRNIILSSQTHLPSQKQDLEDYGFQFTEHSIATACAAEQLAKLIDADSQAAYFAGLLHDIGKFVLLQIMHRSYKRLIEQSNEQDKPLIDIEQKFFFTNHCIVAKRLGEKWRWPKQITYSLWLHHSSAKIINTISPTLQTPPIVAIANIIAKQSALHNFRSSIESLITSEPLAKSQISFENIEMISRSLPDVIKARLDAVAKIKETDQKDPQKSFANTASDLSRENDKLYELNKDNKRYVRFHNYLTDFLKQIGKSSTASQGSCTFVELLGKHYELGKVLIITVDNESRQTIAALASKDGTGELLTSHFSEDVYKIISNVKDDFSVHAIDDRLVKLLDETEADFDLSKTAAASIAGSGGGVYLAIFELSVPLKKSTVEDNLSDAFKASVEVMELLRNNDLQKKYTELLSTVNCEPTDKKADVPPEMSPAMLEKKYSSQGNSDQQIYPLLAELAAGASHELNNPLIVISGRAELLQANEQDPEKKQALDLISKNAHKISDIVEGLMRFAEPQAPVLKNINVKKLIAESVHLAADHVSVDDKLVTIDIDSSVESVFADYDQILWAITNIITNSFESYATQKGPINISAQLNSKRGLVMITISDLGCGMDSTTLSSAFSPFFSAKPAGRKLGMGLAFAKRFIELNGGTIAISSSMGQGTAVAISLPVK